MRIYELHQFVPEIDVSTCVEGWQYCEDVIKYAPWEACLGDDLKNNKALLELNLPKLVQRGDVAKIFDAMLSNWLYLYIVLATRQQLINKSLRVYGISSEGENILCEANYKAVMCSPKLKEQGYYLAMVNINKGDWLIDTTYGKLVETIKSMMGEQLAKHNNLDKTE